MKDLNIGVHTFAMTVPETLERIRACEAAGIDTAWMTCGGAAPDPLAVFAAAALQTERIDFGTCILPTFPRHPIAAAQGAFVVDQLAPGRLRLGVGPSHKPAVEAMFRFPFERPLEHLRDYLSILNPLLKEGKVSYHGPRLHAEAQLAAPANVRVMASALRPNAFRLVGELADGGITWVTPLPFIRDTAAPAMREAAKAAGRAVPKMVAHVPIVVSTERDAVREASLRQFGFYPRLPFYSAMFQDAGFPEAKEGTFSPAMADALVISGSEEEVATRLRQVPSFAVDEIIGTIVNLPGEPTAWQRTVELLGALAKE